MSLDITLFYSPYCQRCAKVRPAVRRAVAACDRQDLVLRELDVVAHVEEAARAGVKATPALAVGGRVVLTGRVSAAQVRKTLDAVR